MEKKEGCVLWSVSVFSRGLIKALFSKRQFVNRRQAAVSRNPHG
jgi:hypothetical protein